MDVRGHQGFDSRSAGVNERRQVRPREFVRRTVRPAVSPGASPCRCRRDREMFAAGMITPPSRKPWTHARRCDHFLRIGGEGAVADDRIVRIRIDIQHRREIEIDSDQRQFSAIARAALIGELGVARFTRRSPRREKWVNGWGSR